MYNCSHARLAIRIKKPDSSVGGLRTNAFSQHEVTVRGDELTTCLQAVSIGKSSIRIILVV